MAIVQAGASAITMIPDDIRFDVLQSGTVLSASPTQLRLGLNLGPSDTGVWELFGVNLTYSASPTVGGPVPDLIGGTLSRMVQTLNGALVIDISSATLSAADFWTQVKANSALAILSGTLAGDDTIYGSNQQQVEGFDVGDDLLGFEGNDVIIAGAGFDTLNGYRGNDYLDGGADTDAAIFGSARAAN
jgi:Ca2+-binding RTX toxin-like protein